MATEIVNEAAADDLATRSIESLRDAIHFSSNDCWDVDALLRAIDAIAGDVAALGGLEADTLADSIHRLARMAQAEVARIANDLDLVNLSMAGGPDVTTAGLESDHA